MSSRTMTAALAVTLTTVTVAIAACGDDDDQVADTAPSESTLTDTTQTDTPTDTEVSVTSEPRKGPPPPLTPKTEATKPAPPPTLPPITGSTAQPDTTDPPRTGRPDMDRATKAAIDDLAGRIGVEPASITVASDERVTWRDGSLGCPQPGVGYTQALVPGRRLILASGAETYAYHGARAGPLTYCESPDPNGAVPGGGATDT